MWEQNRNFTSVNSNAAFEWRLPFCDNLGNTIADVRLPAAVAKNNTNLPSNDDSTTEQKHESGIQFWKTLMQTRCYTMTNKSKFLVWTHANIQKETHQPLTDDQFFPLRCPASWKKTRNHWLCCIMRQVQTNADLRTNLSWQPWKTPCSLKWGAPVQLIVALLRLQLITITLVLAGICDVWKLFFSLRSIKVVYSNDMEKKCPCKNRSQWV